MKYLQRWLGIAALAIMLSACSATAPEAITPTNAPAATEVASVETPVVEEDYCVTCHTDKDQMVALAKPEEVTEGESEGVG